MTSSKSGRLVVRLPVELHTSLAAEAAQQGVSLNTLIVALLAGGIGWKRPNNQRTKEKTMGRFRAIPATGITNKPSPDTYRQVIRQMAGLNAPTPDFQGVWQADQEWVLNDARQVVDAIRAAERAKLLAESAHQRFAEKVAESGDD